jgi:hypothetical protein
MMNKKKLSETHYINCEGDRELTVLNILKECPLLFQVKVGCRQD